MRKIVARLGLMLLAAAGVGCRSASVPPGVGAASASSVVQEFLAAAHAGDVRVMGALFGTASGPIANREPANDVEKRMRALQCYLTHESARVLNDTPGLGADRRVSVELRQTNLVRRTEFTAVPGPGRRWLVSAFDINAVADLCHP